MIAKKLKANTIRNGLHSKREEGKGEGALQFHNLSFQFRIRIQMRDRE